MRSIALALLVAVTGCNEIFGVHRTRHVDAPPDSPDAPPDAMWLPIVFDQQLGTTDSSGAPAPAMQLAFASPPTIQVGKMGDALQPLTYDASLPGVRVPPEIATGVWRFVYQLPDDPVATEIQWSVSSAHLTFPSFGRAGDSPPPTGSGYKITPQGTPPANWPSGLGTTSVIVTSGAITDSSVLPTGSEIDFHYDTGATPVLGTLGTPHSANGDWVALFDWFFEDATKKNYAVTGYAISTASDLAAGSLTASSPTWNTTTQTYPVTFNTFTADMRLGKIAALGTCCTYNLDYGLLPNPHIAPMSAQRKTAGTNAVLGAQTTGLDLPLLISLYTYHASGSVPSGITLADPSTTAIPMARAYYGRDAAPRTDASLDTFESSLQEVSLTTPFQFAASLARGATFAGTNLETSSPPIFITGSTGAMQLTWNDESNQLADDYVITLYQVMSSSLTPVRRYQVMQPSVTVDGSLMQMGSTYVFGIVSRHGFPGVQGTSPDYTAVSLPFSEATTFPLEFKIQ